MKNFFSLILVLVVIYMSFLPQTILERQRRDDMELQTRLLSAAIDYAGEAAAVTCIDRETIATDYSTQNIVFTPDKAATMFATSMCISYGMPATDDNIKAVLRCVPAMVLATNDGYYLAEWMKVSNASDAEYVFAWQPKRPYIHDAPDTKVVYGATMDNTSVVTVNETNLSAAVSTNSPYSDEVALQIVNYSLNSAVNAALQRYCDIYNKDKVEAFYLPLSAEGVGGVSQVSSPTFIALVRDWDLAGYQKINSAVVSGLSIDKKVYLVGWTDTDGLKYYARADRLTESQKALVNSNGVLFKSTDAAVKAGYMPYIYAS